MADSPFHLFGIRHHGPGCARSLMRALETLAPDCLLVEGPPDGEEMLPLLGDPGLVPPVALLVYNPDDSAEAAFYPFAVFSPEWNALQFARAQGIPSRFMDLPMAHQFALDRPDAPEDDAVTASESMGMAPMEAEAMETDVAADDEDTGAMAPDLAEEVSTADPLDWLGRAAGYEDGESWWNHMVEERGDSLDLFAAIREAMTTVRDEAPRRVQSEREAQRESLREAYMRKCMRQAQKEGFQRIAVVCGAWHVPALAGMPAAKTDNDLLKALPKIKVATTWVPWSYRNLSLASGYGAGVLAPGWYEHLWRAPAGQRATSWLARAAAVFRAEGLDCSSAHIIEAVRLSDALAAMRERPAPGLEELREALRTVVCMGDGAPMRFIEQRLIIGDRLGTTPENAPAVPLQRDLTQQQKQLRLKPEATQKLIDLDLRMPNDLARSHLLHRLDLLGIPWGKLGTTGRSAKGSFHEVWDLQWEPGLALAVIEASRWGNTVEEAACARAIGRACDSDSLSALSELINAVLLADLQRAVAPVSRALEDLAAVASDVGQLLAAIPPLANVARYGNVRQTDAGMVRQLLHSLVPRAAIGLPGACSALDGDAAAAMRSAIETAQQAVRLIAEPELQTVWQQALARLAQLGSCHGLVCGYAARSLFEDKHTDIEETALRMSQALSAGNEPAQSAAWLEGFLSGGGMVLLHDEVLWNLVNDWMVALSAEHFMRELPLLRRTFSAFSAPERRQLGERAARPLGAARTSVETAEWDMQRAERPLPVLRLIFGVST